MTGHKHLNIYINVEQSAVNHEGIFFPIYSLLKCSKPNRQVQVVKCVKFDESALDVMILLLLICSEL